MRHKQALGAHGEAIAARHLVQRGLVVLDRNWRCPDGEIDLVLSDGAVLVVCELKTRRSLAYGTPLEAVTAAKAARLRRLAACWLAAHDVRAHDVRIDLVGIVCPHDAPPVIDHVSGVG